MNPLTEEHLTLLFSAGGLIHRIEDDQRLPEISGSSYMGNVISAGSRGYGVVKERVNPRPCLHMSNNVRPSIPRNKGGTYW